MRSTSPSRFGGPAAREPGEIGSDVMPDFNSRTRNDTRVARQEIER